MATDFSRHPTRLKQVNRMFEEAGVAERLVKGNGYFYFAEGNAAGWFTTSVPVYRLSQLTLAQWFEAWRELRKD